MNRKHIALLLCLAALLSLCACGGKTDASDETPAPEQTSAPVQTLVPASESDLEPVPAPPASATDLTVPPASATDLTVPNAQSGHQRGEIPEIPHVTLIPIGQNYAADLDGDGKEEDICVSLEQDDYGYDRVKLTLNGEDWTECIYAEEDTRFDCPDRNFWAVTDVYSVDNLLEIAIQDWGPSCDYYTNFFRYELGGIYSFGGVEGMIWNSERAYSDLSFEEDGFIHSYMRLNVLQTWFADVRYEIAPRGVLDVVREDLYQAKNPTDVTLLVPLTAYNGKGGTHFTVNAGIEMTVLATDNVEWIYCESETEDWALWFHLNPDSGFEIETPDGYVYVGDALDGLNFAD